jgi:hypothetical protein
MKSWFDNLEDLGSWHSSIVLPGLISAALNETVLCGDHRSPETDKDDVD